MEHRIDPYSHLNRDKRPRLFVTTGLWKLSASVHSPFLRADFGREDRAGPPRFELFLLGEGEKKVTVIPETRVPSAATFRFAKEDHTLGNLLRTRLLQNRNVLFAAYKVPHPLFADFELRVQTDGTITPREAVVQACRDIVQDLDVLGREFTKEWELKRISKMGDTINGI